MWNRIVPHTITKLQCNFTTHGRPSNSRTLVFIIDYSSSVVLISLAYVPLNLLCWCAVQILYDMSALSIIL
jgi:hypothetical protein